jgi:magnesium-transporting ATPase (P-type)
MLFCKSAPEMVIPLCDRILADGEIRPFDSGLRTKVRQAQEAMAGQGLRVIAMSYRPLEDHWQRAEVEENLIFAGLAGLEDQPRPEVPEALRKCREAGIKEAADMVLLDDNFASIVNAVEEGRAVFSNIRKFLTYILAHNVPELIPYLVFSLFSVPLALTPIQILSIDMGTDSLTALGLGVEKPDPRMMQRPPRSQHQRLFDWPLALRA